VRLAVVDIGTNSIRYDVHEINSRRQLVCLYRNKFMARLGEDVFLKTELQASAIDRSLNSLKDFVNLCDNLGVDEIVAVGTSALRESKNRDVFIQRAKTELELSIRVISGEEEAGLILKGIKFFETNLSPEFAFVDIGGGSTELGLNSIKNPPILASLPLGAARLQQKFLNRSKTEKDIQNLRDFCRFQLQKMKGTRPFGSLYGSSGTAKALTKILRPSSEARFFDFKDLQVFTKKIKNLSPDELLLIPGMDAKRLDIILPGALLLEEIMIFLGAKKLIRTKHALREGLLIEALESYKWIQPNEKISLLT